MSIMKINHTKTEVDKLQSVIKSLLENYESNFSECDLAYKKIKDDIEKRIVESSNDKDNLSSLFEEENSYLSSIQDLKTFAQFQNELILVKHVALIENMIINLFEYLVNTLEHQCYKDQYFGDNDFSDIFIAVNKISELTDNKINIKGLNFFFYYETMRTIRHSIAHGDSLSKMSYRRLKKFNKIINIISPYREINKDIQSMHHVLLHPTYSSKSEWYCHLSGDISSLITLNSEYSKFIEEIRELLLSYGELKGLSNHELYSWRKIPCHES